MHEDTLKYAITGKNIYSNKIKHVSNNNLPLFQSTLIQSSMWMERQQLVSMICTRLPMAFLNSLSPWITELGVVAFSSIGASRKPVQILIRYMHTWVAEGRYRKLRTVLYKHMLCLHHTKGFNKSKKIYTQKRERKCLAINH